MMTLSENYVFRRKPFLILALVGSAVAGILVAAKGIVVGLIFAVMPFALLAAIQYVPLPHLLVSCFLGANLLINSVLSRDLGLEALPFNLIWIVTLICLGWCFWKYPGGVWKRLAKISGTEIPLLLFLFFSISSIFYSIDRISTIRSLISMVLIYLLFFKGFRAYLSASNCSLHSLFPSLFVVFGIANLYNLATVFVDLPGSPVQGVSSLNDVVIQRSFRGITGEPNGAGGIAWLLLVFSLINLRSQKSRIWKLSSFVGLVVALGTLYLSNSFSAFLATGFSLSLLVWFLQTGRSATRKVAYILCLVLAAFVIYNYGLHEFLTEKTKELVNFPRLLLAISYRWSVIGMALRRWREAPIGGYGLGTVNVVMGGITQDSSYLTLMLETGVLGLWLYMAFALTILLRGVRFLSVLSHEQDPAVRMIVQGCVILLFGLFGLAINQNVIDRPVSVFTQLMYLIAILLDIICCKDSAESPKSPMEDCDRRIEYLE